MKSLALKTVCKVICALSLGATAVSAQAAYPEKTITLNVPAAPGGTVDIVARLLSDQFAKFFGQPSIVMNRPGAGGVLGTQFMLKEAADGYSLLVTANSNQLIVPWVYKNAKFDPIKDFVPVAAVGIVSNILCVHPSFPAKDLKGFIAEVKANPNKYQYASAGSGTLNHLLGEMLNEQGGLKLQHVPYKGVGPAMNDVMGNHVPMLFASLPSAVDAVKSGKVRAIGVSSMSRASILPDVPAINEQIRGFNGDLWVAVYAPKGTSQNVVNRLNDGVRAALAAPEVQQRFKSLGITILHDGPKELARRQEAEYQQWRKIVQSSGATAE